MENETIQFVNRERYERKALEFYEDATLDEQFNFVRELVEMLPTDALRRWTKR